MDNVEVLEPPPRGVDDTDAVKEPEGKDEDKEDDADASTEQVDPRHGRPRLAEEQGPRTEEQDQELEAKADE